ncbi:MAG TPA: hypothetical protein VLW52_15155 [Opitutaceae bacterium]|nr:hypothetical protein [Opitutaceae bacterium]
MRWGREPVTDASCNQKIAMGAGAQQDLSDKDKTLQRRLRLLGIVVLTAGLLAAILVRQRTPPDDGTADLFKSGTLLSGNAKRYENEMKDLGGQSNVVAAEFREWFGSLWHGRRLANTLAVLSIGTSLACFFLAHLLNYPPPPEDQGDGEPGANPEAGR